MGAGRGGSGVPPGRRVDLGLDSQRMQKARSKYHGRGRNAGIKIRLPA